MAKCFASAEELTTFYTQMECCMNELQFLSDFRDRVNDDEGVLILMREICVFSIFCREHFDLIRQLVGTIQSKSVTEDEYKKLME